MPKKSKGKNPPIPTPLSDELTEYEVDLLYWSEHKGHRTSMIGRNLHIPIPPHLEATVAEGIETQHQTYYKDYSASMAFTRSHFYRDALPINWKESPPTIDTRGVEMLAKEYHVMWDTLARVSNRRTDGNNAFVEFEEYLQRYLEEGGNGIPVGSCPVYSTIRDLGRCLMDQIICPAHSRLNEVPVFLD